MNREEFIAYCKNTYAAAPDNPFEGDFETTVLRHSDTKKWYALVMRVAESKFGFEGEKLLEVVNMKLPEELIGSFGKEDGVYPAYHMNKHHWISVLLDRADDETVELLTHASYIATQSQKKNKLKGKCP